ncbi:hypothetical protein OEA41_000039 [Lepraria neglecta]|uniref:Uncharacterized protein n=1 Tax=Lepraria neglecta TaxID=209136 RepID=A0AAD9ZII8_9LECA|nr:hypothetical protein OEA41_000039 [Lepraria neglecta]
MISDQINSDLASGRNEDERDELLLNRTDMDHIFPPIAAAPLNPKVNAQWSLEQSERKRLRRAMAENEGQVKGEEVSYREGNVELESLFGEPDGTFDLEMSRVLQGEENGEAK